MLLLLFLKLLFLLLLIIPSLSSGTITQLESSTEPLNQVFFPSLTICNLNQVNSYFYSYFYYCIFNVQRTSGDRDRSFMVLMIGLDPGPDNCWSK